MNTEYGANVLQLYNLSKGRFNWRDLTTCLHHIDKTQSDVGVEKANQKAKKDQKYLDKLMKKLQDNQKAGLFEDVKKITKAIEKLKYSMTQNSTTFSTFEEYLSTLTYSPSVYVSNGYNPHVGGPVTDTNILNFDQNNESNTAPLPYGPQPLIINIDNTVRDLFQKGSKGGDGEDLGDFSVDGEDGVVKMLKSNSLLMDFRQMSLSHATVAFVHSIHQYCTLVQNQTKNGKKSKNNILLPKILLFLPKENSNIFFEETPLISEICTSEFVQKTNHFEGLLQDGLVTMSKVLCSSEKHQIDVFSIQVNLE
jgi:hypothetical protein